MHQIHVVNLSNPRGRSRLGRDLCRGLNAGDRRKKRRKRKSCAGGRGNKSVRPPVWLCAFLFCSRSIFSVVSCSIDRKTNGTPRSTCPPTRCDETPNVYVFSRVDTKTIDPFGHVLRVLELSFIGIFILRQMCAFFFYNISISIFVFFHKMSQMLLGNDLIIFYSMT